MAFVNRIGSILKQAGSKHVNAGLAASNSSVYQAIRCMSSSKLFVGGLSYGTDEISLREAFGQYGQVVEARVIMDRDTGRSRGFGFVSYTSSEEASSAAQAMDGQDLQGRRVRVSFATEKPRVGGFGGGYGGGGYGGGNSYSAGGSGYGGANYGNAGGSNYGGGMSGGGNYGSSGSGSYGGGNYGGMSGGVNYGSSGSSSYGGGNYGSSTGGGSYDGGNGNGYGTGVSGNSGNYSVSGGSENYDSGGPVSSGGFSGPGYGGTTGAPSIGGEEQLGSSIGGNYRDDDVEPDNYANTRA
ncbi:hypothetical protein LguiA_017292 [Lonicera macranthoides]